MSRAPLDRWLHPMLLVALVGLSAFALDGPQSPGVNVAQGRLVALAQAATWPMSDRLLVSEIVTGGSSASDEFVELYNASTADVDLSGVELVYVTASGSTVTRKQTWTGLALPAHRHLLLANSSGTWAAAADGLYSGGFASTGGSLVLRFIGGSVLDALSWGNASNQFVEGSAGEAPPSGASLERLPGGGAGNALDTNDNAADTHVEPVPVAQGLTAAPTPDTHPTPSATSTAGPSDTATPTLTPSPTVDPVGPCPTAMPSAPPTPTASAPAPSATPTPDATGSEPPAPSPIDTALPTPTEMPSAIATNTPAPSPTEMPIATASPSPTPMPSPSPSPTPSPTPTPTPSPSPSPTPTPSPSPSPTPTPSPTPVPTPTPAASPSPSVEVLTTGEARLLPIGATATVRGSLTTPAGLTEAGRGAFIEDGGAGLGLYLVSGDWPSVVPGQELLVSGTISSRDSQLTLDIGGDGIAIVGYSPLPDPILVATGLVCEPLESRLVTVEGLITGAPEATEEGIRTFVDDGTGALAVVATDAAAVPANEFVVGARMRLVGVLGQRDLTGAGTGGYRLFVRSIDDLGLANASPTPTPTTTPSPAPTPTPTPVMTAPPTPTPLPTAAVQTIATARLVGEGGTVRVSGAVIAEPGNVLNEAVLAIQDASAGILVRLPAGSYPDLTLGRVLEVEGELAAPYQNLELRPDATGLTVLSTTTPPAPRQLSAIELGEQTEGLLAELTGMVARIDSSASGSVTLFVSDSSGDGRVFLDARLGLRRSDFAVGETLTIVGVVGDRLGLYRLWPRSTADITHVTGAPSPAPTAGPTPSDTPTASAEPSPAVVISIVDAMRRAGQVVAVEGVVTSAPGLLDGDGRRVTLQDATGAVVARLPADMGVHLGERVQVTGTMSTYYGAPSLSATIARVLGQGSVSPASVRLAPLAAGLEWRLVTVNGRIESVHRDGDAWRAELALPGGTVPISGLSRSDIPSAAVQVGRDATVTGIVKRAYPTAADQRLAVVPRSTEDIRLGQVGAPGADPAAPAGSADSAPTAPATGAGSGGDTAGDGQAMPTSSTLADLAGHVAQFVTVGGTITTIAGPRLTIDDATATAVVRLDGQATLLVGTLGVGDLINATGLVARIDAGGLEIVVDDPTTIRRLARINGASAPPVSSAPAAVYPAGKAEDGSQPDSARPPLLFVLAATLGLVAAAALLLLLDKRTRHAVVMKARDALARSRLMLMRLHRG